MSCTVYGPGRQDVDEQQRDKGVGHWDGEGEACKVQTGRGYARAAAAAARQGGGEEGNSCMNRV